MVRGAEKVNLSTCYAAAANIALTVTSLLFYDTSTYTPPTCDGGFYTTAVDRVAEVGGVGLESAYPYDFSVLQCDSSKNDNLVTTTKWTRVEGQQAMIDYVLGGGTLVVSLDASNMGSYKSGIFSGCVQTFADHAVQIVGVNVEEGYWIIRNSWGDWWGDNGYLKLAIVSTNRFKALLC